MVTIIALQQVTGAQLTENIESNIEVSCAYEIEEHDLLTSASGIIAVHPFIRICQHAQGYPVRADKLW